MTTPSLAHRAEALLVRLALAILRRLPPAAASNLAGFAAGSIGPFIPTSRRVGDVNLRMAMPELTPTERRRIIAETWENLGRTAAELVHLGGLHETASGPGYKVTGWEEYGAPLVGRPFILFTAHLGNWEVIPPAFFTHGAELGFMYRAASNPLVDGIILRMREANFNRKLAMFPKGSTGARQAYAHLQRGGNLALLVDQKLDNGIAVPFFGIPAMTAPAMASFALRFRCPVLPCHTLRIGPARIEVILEAPLTLPNSGNKEADVLTLTTAMNQTLERWIREKPGQWLWLHRRWPKELYKKK